MEDVHLSSQDEYARIVPAAATTSKAYGALRAELGSGKQVRPVPADAFRAALRRFVSDPRLDMGVLASDLGVSKATVYRWTGSREQLLSEVLMYFSDVAMDTALAQGADRAGVERVEAFTRIYLGQVVTFEPLGRFIQHETRLAFRLLTSRGGLVQQNVVRRTAELLDGEATRGGLVLRAPSEELAYALTRMTEGFIYNDSLAEVQPDIEAAVRIVRLLLA